MSEERFLSLRFTPGSLSLDINTNILYILEYGGTHIHKFSMITKKPIDNIGFNVLGQPTGITYDKSGLFILDKSGNNVTKYDSSGNKISEIKLKKIYPGDYYGLASDGKYLWGAIRAKWSSRIFRINPSTGTVSNSFFCECDPMDLASDGKIIWTICYNGPVIASLIDEREIQRTSDMYNNRKFPVKLKIKTPTGLTYYRARRLLVADRDVKAIYIVRLK